MGRLRIDWNNNAFYDIRRDPAIVQEEVAAATRIADAANAMGKGTYHIGSRQGEKRPQGRWRTSVVTADAKAMAENAKHNTLVRAMGSV